MPLRCSVPDCGSSPPRLRRGWCSAHYLRWYKTGDPEGSNRPSLEERFWVKVNKNGPVPQHRPDLGPCWLWLAFCDDLGYGRFHVYENGRRRTVFAHNVSYRLAHGQDVPPGLEPDHLCRVAGCVNPDHLEAVTRRENQHRGDSPSGRNARKTHCLQDHAFDQANTYISPRGGRSCRQCTRDRQRRRP